MDGLWPLLATKRAAIPSSVCSATLASRSRKAIARRSASCNLQRSLAGRFLRSLIRRELIRGLTPKSAGKRKPSRETCGRWRGFRKPRHLPQVSRDGFRLPALFGVNPRISSRRINERKNRPAKLRCKLHDAERLAIAFRLRLAKVALQTLLGIAALLVANNGHRPSMKFCQSGNQCFVVAISAVA